MPTGDRSWWRLESPHSPYSSSGKYPPKQPSFPSLTEQKRCQPSFFSPGLLQPCTSGHLFEVDVAVWCRSQFLCFFFFFLFCSAHLGLLVFGTMMKRDGDKTWLPSIWRHCLCRGAFFAERFIRAAQKWLCETWRADFTELAEVYSSRDVWPTGAKLPPFVLSPLCISYLNERILLMRISLGLQSQSGLLYVFPHLPDAGGLPSVSLLPWPIYNVGCHIAVNWMVEL